MTFYYVEYWAYGWSMDKPHDISVADGITEARRIACAMLSKHKDGSVMIRPCGKVAEKITYNKWQGVYQIGDAYTS